MKYEIRQLIDLQQLERLMQSLHKATGMPYGVVDKEGKILIGVGWKDICTKFHRAHPASVAQCTESDRYVIAQAQDGPYFGHRCPRGLMSYATPLVIEGERLASVFTGQVLNEPSDTNFFEAQAEAFGFDKPSYMEALKAVPVLPTESIEAVMIFLVELAQMLASNGLNRLRELEAENDLLRAKQQLEREVDERKLAETSLLNYAERLQLMTQRSASLQEAEQRRLARELHDQVSSNLWALRLTLNSIEKQLADGTLDTVRDRLSDCAALLDDTLQSTRNISSDLHPAVLDSGGLFPALEDLASKFGKRTNLAVKLTRSGEATRLPVEKELVLFRIVQEALVNCAKHSEATIVPVMLSRDDPERIQLMIKDNGVGFDPLEVSRHKDGTGLGLLAMQERAAAVGGKCRIESIPAAGTQVIVELRP